VTLILVFLHARATFFNDFVVRSFPVDLGMTAEKARFRNALVQ
jgi:hypothetical protein